MILSTVSGAIDSVPSNQMLMVTCWLKMIMVGQRNTAGTLNSNVVVNLYNRTQKWKRRRRKRRTTRRMMIMSSWRYNFFMLSGILLLQLVWLIWLNQYEISPRKQSSDSSVIYSLISRHYLPGGLSPGSSAIYSSSSRHFLSSSISAGFPSIHTTICTIYSTRGIISLALLCSIALHVTTNLPWASGL